MNHQIIDLFLEDQKDREEIYKLFRFGVTEEEFEQRNKWLYGRDKRRRSQAKVMLENNEIQSSEELYSAATIFLHGSVSEEYALAFLLARRVFLESKHEKLKEKALVLTKCAIDRWNLCLGFPQDFGTQFKRLPNGDKERLPMSSVSSNIQDEWTPS